MCELLTSCALGYTAARVGLFDGPAIRALSKVVFNIFLPAMLFTSVSCTVAHGASLRSLIVIPLAAVTQILVGFLKFFDVLAENLLTFLACENHFC